VSDNGKEFANNILEELCKLMRIEKHLITSYHPQANAQAERFNRDMRKYLMTMLEETSDWVTYLKPLQFAHNTALNKSTKFTPHYLTYLDNPRLPDSIDKQNATYSESYTADAFRRLKYAYNLVYSNNEQARVEYTKQFNKKCRTRRFEVGDEVLVSFPINVSVVNKKLSPIWKGPFRVCEVNGNILKVQATPRSKTITVHVNRIQLFHHLKDIASTNVRHQITPAEPQVIQNTEEEEEDDWEVTNTRDPQQEEIENPVQAEDQQEEQQAEPEQRPVTPIRIVRETEDNWAIQRPIQDRLAEEIFGPIRRPTRATTRAPEVELPNRPIEYKKKQKKK
jgi:hypothetical protein